MWKYSKIYYYIYLTDSTKTCLKYNALFIKPMAYQLKWVKINIKINEMYSCPRVEVVSRRGRKSKHMGLTTWKMKFSLVNKCDIRDRWNFQK